MRMVCGVRIRQDLYSISFTPRTTNSAHGCFKDNAGKVLSSAIVGRFSTRCLTAELRFFGRVKNPSLKPRDTNSTRGCFKENAGMVLVSAMLGRFSTRCLFDVLRFFIRVKTATPQTRSQWFLRLVKPDT